MTDPHLMVVGGGVSGLAAAHELSRSGRVRVTLRERDTRLGGKIASSRFAGLEGIDEGADAFLTRVPHAVQIAGEIGLTERLTSPTTATAAVWHDGLHAIPDGVMLGVPASVRPFVRTSLLSWRGKARAAIEPLLPRTDPHDSLGALVRARFGDEVHERLVDALVGSIYATDTDRSSLAAVPQLAQLAGSHRSLLLGARRIRRPLRSSGTTAQIFAAPTGGMHELITALGQRIEAAGGLIERGGSVATIEPDGDGWRVDDIAVDGVIVATPAAVSAELLAGVSPMVADELRGLDTADVVMIRLAVPHDRWPDRLAGRSGYLVPKPDQKLVTAASFGSQKWAHWLPPDGQQILRVSLGRDGLQVMHLDDDELIRATVDELGHHLGFDVQPSEVSVRRWHGAFPQYRPRHHDRVASIERQLPGTIELAGASFHGIGIPACIATGRAAARRLEESLTAGRSSLT